MGIRGFLRRTNYQEILRIADIVYHSIQTGEPSGGEPASGEPAASSQPPKHLSGSAAAPEPAPAVALVSPADERRRARRERGALWARWLTLFAIVAFAAVTYFQLRAVTSQLADAERENGIADRPYIFITAVSIGQDGKTKQAQATVSLANYGHSPALHTRTAEALVVGDTNVTVGREAADFFASPFSTDAVAFDYPPTSPGDNRITFPLTSAAPPTQVLHALSIDGGLKALVRSEYSDVRGRPYKTEACFYRRADGSIGACDQYNHLE